MPGESSKPEPIDVIEPLLTAKDVEKILKVSLATVYNLAARQQLPAVAWNSPGCGKRSSRVVRFKKADIIAFIQSNYQQGGQ